MDLPQYKTLSEVEANFKVEYINNCYDFYCLIQQVQHETETIYRGVSSARYKMYSSAQRCFNDCKKAEGPNNLPIELEYSELLELLYKVSPELGNGYLNEIYARVKDNNYVQYVQRDGDGNIIKSDAMLTLNYNPIWVYHTLQHITECSPFLDFSKNFAVALFFASQKLLSCCNIIAKNEIDNYIEIVAIKEDTRLKGLKNDLSSTNKYQSLFEEVFNGCEDSTEAGKRITSFKLPNYNNKSMKSIKYICFSSDGQTKCGRGIDWHFNFANANCVAQDGRLVMTSAEPNQPFEDYWNAIIGESSRLQAYLIHKSLVNEICRYLTGTLLGKAIVPIKQDYKQDIIRLINQKYSK